MGLQPLLDGGPLAGLRMSSERIGGLHLQSHSSSLWCADQVPEAETLKQQVEATAVPNTYMVKLVVSVVELRHINFLSVPKSPGSTSRVSALFQTE